MLALGSLAVLLATFLAGVVGFAYGLIALPLLLVIGVPLPIVILVNLLIGLVTRLGVVVRLRRRINMGRTALLVGGSVPGIAVGLLVRSAVSTRVIELAAGVLTIVAVVVLSRLSPSDERSSTSRVVTLGAGGLGGMLGVTTSLNGVPPALLLFRERASANTVVADLGAYFVAGNALTIALLMLSRGAARLDAAWPLLALWLPVGVLGQALGVALGGRMPHRAFRMILLVVAVASGIASVLRAV